MAIEEEEAEEGGLAGVVVVEASTEVEASMISPEGPNRSASSSLAGIAGLERSASSAMSNPLAEDTREVARVADGRTTASVAEAEGGGEEGDTMGTSEAVSPSHAMCM